MEAVTYMSSAGIRVLIGCYKDLKAINGSFTVTSPSAKVRTILDMTHLSPLLLSDESFPDSPPATAEHGSAFKTDSGVFELLDTRLGQTLECRVLGDATRLEAGGYMGADLSAVEFPPGTFGLGLGAFGSDFSDCRDRFGEFLAVGGAAVYLPTDGASVPDYVVAAGNLVPEVQVLYGIRCEGRLSHHLRFQADEESRHMGFAEVVHACLTAAGARDRRDRNAR